MKKLLLLSSFLLVFACANNTEDLTTLTQEQISARLEAARLADSLLNFSSILEEERGLSQLFMGVHTHQPGGSGNLAFDAHQDPVATRIMIENFARLAERYREAAPQIQESRQRMMQAFREAQADEERRIW